MPRKNAAARKRAVLLPTHQTWYDDAAIGIPPGLEKSAASHLDEDDQLAKAILASKASSMQNGTYKDALACALNLSELEAKQEAEEAEILRLAVAASLADAREKDLALGLHMASSRQAAHCPSQSHEHTSFSAPHLDPAAPRGICALHVPSSESIAPCPLSRAIVEALATDATLSRILKVTYEQDTRRLYTQWSSGAQASNILTCIEGTIEESFGLPLDSAAPPVYFLKYLDDEGDLCTLVEHTLTDFLGTSIQGSSLKIFLQKGHVQRPQKIDFPGFEETPWSCDVEKMQGIEVTGWDRECWQDIQNVEKMELSALADFSIATRPSTPRGDSPTSCSGSIEDDYDSAWAIIELEN